MQGCPKTRGKKGGQRNGEEGSKRERGRFTYLQTKGRVMRHWKKIYKQDTQLQTYTDNIIYKQEIQTDIHSVEEQVPTGETKIQAVEEQTPIERTTDNTIEVRGPTGETDNTDNGTAHTDRRDRQWDNTYRQERQTI